MSSKSFSPYSLGPVELRNRIVMAPMCQYSSEDGFVSSWHGNHYLSRAAGGVGAIILEATAVEARGRISPGDLGIWSDDHVAGLSKLAWNIRDLGAAAGIQLAHAGRKASTSRPFDGFGPLKPSQGGWQPVAPSPIAYAENYSIPSELTLDDIQNIQESFLTATRRAITAGFQIIELHAAHGYLIHSFLSPLTNQREDQYGGSFENRTRFLLELAALLRAECAGDAALVVRISATDWAEGGWNLAESVNVSALLRDAGVDMMHISGGGLIAGAGPDRMEPGYMVPFADEIHRKAEIPTIAVGLITRSELAERILAEDRAQLVALGRVLLRNPYWCHGAARELGVNPNVPKQYARAWKEELV